jgi:broad specificity phosphatase PhoE
MLNDSHEKHFPYIQNYWNQVGPLFSRPVGGESILDLIEKRLHRFIDVINKEYAGKKICLVTHGRVITGMRMVLENMSITEVEDILTSTTMGPKNVGLTVYTYNPWTNAYNLERYNKTYYNTK